jgi:hypothetical protein
VIIAQVDPGSPVYDGPGSNNIWWIPSEDLDAGSFSSSSSPALDVRRVLSNITFNWTTQGACIDAVPNGVVNAADKGIVYRECLPVRNSDFNHWKIYQLRIEDEFGSDECFGLIKVIPVSGALVSVPTLHVIVPASMELQREFVDSPEISTASFLSVFPVQEVYGLSVYPNPGHDHLVLEWNAEAVERVSITVTDLVGRVVAEANLVSLLGQNALTMNLSARPSGTYLVNMRSSNNSETRIWLKLQP